VGVFTEQGAKIRGCASPGFTFLLLPCDKNRISIETKGKKESFACPLPLNFCLCALAL
jgi:hypothetical protein